MPSNNYTQVKIRKDTLEVLRERAKAQNRSMANLLDLLIVGEQVHTPNRLAQGFGLLEPCHGHDRQWDCGRPGCKYGAGK